MLETDLDRWRRVDALFSAALDQPPESRRAFLETASGGDPELLAEVESLLASLERAEHVIGDSADRLLAPEPDAEPRGPGHRIGAYRVVREIGRGGMGVVYLAERADAEFDRQVAVKVVRPGHAGDLLLSRFRAEARILAGLEHPNIARLYDSGVADEGQPYLVMEYVDGARVDRYADGRRLSIDHRLALFDAICDAVGYAHQRLVVHRDLKPANILVAADGRPRLLDFGVAKLLAAGDDEPVTRPAQRMLTPEYAAPEQLRGDRVTAAADVFALGVILYELLVGRRPPRQGPVAPSAALRQPPADRWDPDAVAAARGASLSSLARSCRGDLDTIVLTALAADPGDRYRSVQSLQDDIRRFRAARPIAARPLGPVGRAGKFGRRNPLLVATAVAALVLAVGYVLTLNTQNQRIRAERDRAERVTGFLVDLFQANDPFGPTRRDTTRLADFLAQSSARVEAELQGQPSLQAALLTALGRANHGLGDLPAARRLLERAVEQRVALSPLDLATTVTELAGVAHRQGRLDEADSMNREALAIRQRTRGGETAAIGNLANLGLILMDQGKLDTAAAILDRAIALDRAIVPIDTSRRSELLNGRSAVAYRSGKPDLALSLSREALGILQAKLDSTHPRVLAQQGNIAFLLDRSGRAEEAVPLLEVTLAGLRTRLPSHHPAVLANMATLGAALGRLGRHADAVVILGEVVAIERERMPEDRQRVFALDNYATTLLQLGRPDDAEGAWREALDIATRASGPGHPSAAVPRSRLANLRCERPGDRAAWAGAIDQFRASLLVLDQAMGVAHPMRLGVRAQYGACLLRLGRSDQARSELEPSYAVARDSLGARHPIVGVLGSNLLRLYVTVGDSGAAGRLRAELGPPVEKKP